ncbi:hypothetical protein [Streptomyces sp. NPDC046712]|uniref:hypothetical protein n=1 Tax=Streptomyces sp. NPDC046712 TaxID=3154802 RepID=UPI003404BA31
MATRSASRRNSSAAGTYSSSSRSPPASDSRVWGEHLLIHPGVRSVGEDGLQHRHRVGLVPGARQDLRQLEPYVGGLVVLTGLVEPCGGLREMAHRAGEVSHVGAGVAEQRVRRRRRELRVVVPDRVRERPVQQLRRLRLLLLRPQDLGEQAARTRAPPGPIGGVHVLQRRARSSASARTMSPRRPAMAAANCRALATW